MDKRYYSVKLYVTSRMDSLKDRRDRLQSIKKSLEANGRDTYDISLQIQQIRVDIAQEKLAQERNRLTEMRLNK